MEHGIGDEDHAYLPVLRISLKHHRVFRLAYLALVNILNLLCFLLSLNAVILRESTLVTFLRLYVSNMSDYNSSGRRTLRASARKCAPTGSTLLWVAVESLPSGLKLFSPSQSAGRPGSL